MKMESYHCYRCHTLIYMRDCDENSPNVYCLSVNGNKTSNLEVSGDFVYCKCCKSVIGHIFNEHIFNININRTFRIIKNDLRV